MPRKVVIFALVLGLLLTICELSYAHGSQSEHDADLKYVLFGSKDKKLSGDAKDAFDLISDAAALCIDQFSPNDEAQWKSSKYEKLASSIGLTIPFEKIDLNRSNSGGSKNVTANTHREYTHQGWEYKNYPNQEFWDLRKSILIDTVQKVIFSKSDTLLDFWPWLADKVYGDHSNYNA